MAEEQTPAPAPAAPPAAPAESAAPGPSPTTQAALDVIDARTKPADTMWGRMVEQLGSGKGPEEPAESLTKMRERVAPTEAAPAVKPAPVVSPPGTPAARRFAGRFETPEALEAGYTELEQARSRAETERQRAVDTTERLERLLMASWQQAGARPEVMPDGRTAPPPMTPELNAALTAVTRELQLLAVGDQQGDVLRLVRAVALASHADQASRRAYADVALSEYDQRANQQAELESLKASFFKQYPDLQTVRPSLLRQVAMETEELLRRGRRDYGSAQFVQDWFTETAKVAREQFRLSGGAASPAALSANPQAAPTTTVSSRPARVAAPFSESPSSRSSEPVATGQDVYLARVFGGQR